MYSGWGSFSTRRVRLSRESDPWLQLVALFEAFASVLAPSPLSIRPRAASSSGVLFLLASFRPIRRALGCLTNQNNAAGPAAGPNAQAMWESVSHDGSLGRQAMVKNRLCESWTRRTTRGIAFTADSCPARCTLALPGTVYCGFAVRCLIPLMVIWLLKAPPCQMQQSGCYVPWRELVPSPQNQTSVEMRACTNRCLSSPPHPLPMR